MQQPEEAKAGEKVGMITYLCGCTVFTTMNNGQFVTAFYHCATCHRALWERNAN